MEHDETSAQYWVTRARWRASKASAWIDAVKAAKIAGVKVYASVKDPRWPDLERLARDIKAKETEANENHPAVG